MIFLEAVISVIAYRYCAQTESMSEQPLPFMSLWEGEAGRASHLTGLSRGKSRQRSLGRLEPGFSCPRLTREVQH